MRIDVVVPFFANVDEVLPTLNSVAQQRLPSECGMSLIVVDDGTPDGGAGAARIRDSYPGATVVRLEENSGRAVARNRGVAAGDGGVVLLLDSDCVLEDDRIIASHIERLETSDVSIGAVASNAPGVWGELGNQAGRRRSAEADSGPLALLTTAHVAIKRDAFEAVGGFSLAYRQYGFEDRDLLARLDKAGFRLTHAADLVAVESDSPTLAGYTRKARMAGRHTAATFRDDHPDLYAVTPYHRIDVSVHRWLRPAAWLSRPLLPLLVRAGERLIKWPVVPMVVRLALVRSLFALEYMVGTAETTTDRP